MQWKRAMAAGAMLTLALGAGAAIPAQGAGVGPKTAQRVSGQQASAFAWTESGPMYVMGLDLKMSVRNGEAPADIPTGLVAMSLPPDSEDPEAPPSELWCSTYEPGAATFASKLASADLSFTCAAQIVTYVCTEEKECEEIATPTGETLTVEFNWTAAGPPVKTRSQTRISGDGWMLQHSRTIQREATASGTIIGSVHGSYFEGEVMLDEKGEVPMLVSFADSMLSTAPAIAVK